MNRITAMTIVCLSGAGLAVVSWLAITHKNSAIETQTRFDRASRFALPEVERCLKSGNRSRVFGQFQYVLLSRGYGRTGSVYIDQDGSRLSVYPRGDKTVVTFKSARVASPGELDLLEWCVKNPQLTWIRPEIR